MKLTVILLILLGVMLNASAQLLLKAGADKLGHFAFSWGSLFPIGWEVARNAYILIGLFCYVISVAVWIMVLSRVDVTIAYPMVSLGYIVTAIAAYYWLGESLPPLRLIGIFVILLGVYMVARG